MRHTLHQTHNLDHILTRLDPRVKLVSALALLVMVISSRGFFFPLLVGVLGLALCLSMGIRLRLLAIRFAEPLFIAVMIVVLKLFFVGHEPLFSLHLAGFDLVGHRDGLREGLLIAGRIGGAVALVAAVGFSTPFTDLMAALSWLRMPQGFIEVSLFAWRYLFVLFDDAQVVYAAQKNRLGYTGYRRGLRSFGTLAGALVIKAFDNSQQITTAMVQRGYDGNLPLLKHKPFRTSEVTGCLAAILAMAALWQY
jgi:cobalt/nickel transport system permease protein